LGDQSEGNEEKESRTGERIAFVLFFISCMALAFGYGTAAVRFDWFPYNILRDAAKAGADWSKNWKAYTKTEPVKHLRPAKYEGQGVTVYDKDKSQPGATLLAGVWKGADDWHLGLRLVGPKGNLIHEWPVNPKEIWPVSPHSDLEKGGWSDKYTTHIHGATLVSGGDVIFNLEYLGLVRMNACGKVVWKLPSRTHHVVYPSGDGTFWVAGRRWIEQKTDRHPGLISPYTEETLLQVSKDGKVLRDISVLDVIYESGHEGLMFASKYEPGIGTGSDNDFMHLNDVEVLEESMADAFPLFRVGDIMISLRNINAVMVIDGKKGHIKWSITHPFIRQHDPDFTKDGFITVFDNRREGFNTVEPQEFGGSRIIKINPATKEVTKLYPKKPEQKFFSNVLGKHQHLANGNMLLSEAEFGRALEVTRSGEIVWSYINRWDETRTAFVEQATRYPAQFAQVSKSSCR